MQFRSFDEGALYWKRHAPRIDTITLHLDGITEIGRLRMHIKHIDVLVVSVVSKAHDLS